MVPSKGYLRNTQISPRDGTPEPWLSLRSEIIDTHFIVRCSTVGRGPELHRTDKISAA